MQQLTRALALGMLGVGIIGVNAAQAGDTREKVTLQVPQGAGVTAAALRTTGRAGEVFPVHVYLSNINDLGAYQLRLKATGGTQGTLTVKDLKIDQTRKDYVFGQEKTVPTISRDTALLAAVKWSGGATIGKPLYAGTFDFVASADAKGVFSIVIEKGPAASLLTNSVAQTLPFELGKTATITIGATPKRSSTDR